MDSIPICLNELNSPFSGFWASGVVDIPVFSVSSYKPLASLLSSESIGFLSLMDCASSAKGEKGVCYIKGYICTCFSTAYFVLCKII